MCSYVKYMKKVNIISRSCSYWKVLLRSMKSSERFMNLTLLFKSMFMIFLIITSSYWKLWALSSQFMVMWLVQMIGRKRQRTNWKMLQWIGSSYAWFNVSGHNLERVQTFSEKIKRHINKFWFNKDSTW